MASRKQNERRFTHWEDLPNGGRRYWFDVPGAKRGFARYVKWVDTNEDTLRFVQEIPMMLVAWSKPTRSTRQIQATSR